MLKWSEHMERMEDQLVKRIVESNVRGVRMAINGMD